MHRRDDGPVLEVPQGVHGGGLDLHGVSSFLDIRRGHGVRRHHCRTLSRMRSGPVNDCVAHRAGPLPHAGECGDGAQTPTGVTTGIEPVMVSS